MAQFEKDKETENLTPEQREMQERVEQKKALDRVIRGVNDVFEKTYKFEELDLEFTVKMRYPNAIEVGRIQARLARYLEGMNNYASTYVITVYSTLAAIREVGIDVPEFLDDDEKIYNLEILHLIGRDFQQWMDNFRF
ncbi:tail assembly chaperone [Bacillus phage Shbh1]|uniref:Tail assembly chaperone n=1 Tax=Bacillus phage Shbh1 TaxID=1796992 RepID=A0A142F1E6_9CAUD|nr:tail assembly chaperone [Bacillus phage Shbh1]AMQ66603.1 hypothetical protein [Bacillus phage Shbh1]